MGRLRFVICLLLLAAFLMVFAQSLKGVIPFLQENLPFRPAVATAKQKPQPAAGDVLTGAAQEAKNVSGQLLSWKNQIAEFSQKLTLANFPELAALATSEEEKPLPSAKPAAAPQPKPQKPSVLDIMMEDQRPPLENKLLGPEISALLDDFLARRREYNTQLAQTTQTLFGDDAAQEAIYVLFTDETASYANAATCQTPKAFAANQNNIDQNTEKNMLQIFKRYQKQLGRQHDGVSPAWKAFFKRVKDYERVVANGQSAAEPQK